MTIHCTLGRHAGCSTACMMSTTASEPKHDAVDVLEARYELGELLGAGSMGQVYQARDTVLGIDVAVKLMHVEHVSSRTRVARFTSRPPAPSRASTASASSIAT